MSDTPGDPLLSAYVADIVERTHSLKEISDKLARDEYVSHEAPELIRMIGSLATDFREAIFYQWNHYVSTRKSIYLTQLRAIDEKLRRVAGDLRLPARATSQRVPGVLTRLVAAKLINFFPNSGVILRPQWNYNYKIHRQDVHSRYRQILQNTFITDDILENRLRGLKEPLFIISFPIIERHSIHLHSVLGHELGHIISRPYRTPSGTSRRFNDFLSELHRAKRQRHPNRELPLQLLISDPNTEKAISARKCAIREFAADAASIFLFGITAFLGAARIAISKNLNGPRSSDKNDYPTWGNRLFYMLELAKKEGCLLLPNSADAEVQQATSVVNESLKEISTWVGDDVERWKPRNEWAAHGHASAAHLLPDIHEYIRREFEPKVLADPSRTYERLPNLYKRLRKKIPPDNILSDDYSPEQPNLEDIFTASWWHRLSDGQPIFEKGDLSDETRKKADQLRRLTLKAIENVDFFKRFSERINPIHET